MVESNKFLFLFKRSYKTTRTDGRERQVFFRFKKSQLVSRLKGSWATFYLVRSERLKRSWSTYHLERSERLKESWSSCHLERSERLKGSLSTNYLERSERLKWSWYT